MNRIVIVGSGPSAVHFALSVLRKGYEVTMLDVGYSRPRPLNPEDSFAALKRNLKDPVAYFLGLNYEGLLLPDQKKEYYGIPPNKDYVFRTPAGFEYAAKGFAPLFSFARGGLAEVWTAGCYPFNDAELVDFPFDYSQLAPCYSEVARRIGIVGAPDDLARFLPVHDHLMEPLQLDRHSALLLAEYEKWKTYLNEKLNCFFGRTRIAALSRDQETRKSCAYLGRCLWGCPADSLYTPSLTLAQCQQFPNFRYLPNLRVTHFSFDSGQHITRVVADPVDGAQACEFPVEKLVLAAGTLSSSKIFLESIFRNTGKIIQLHGLMDNRQILVPFVNLRLVGEQYNPESYQYHQLGLGIETEDPKGYVHGQITTLKTALLHPIILNLPFDLKTSAFLARNMHCALGIINVNLHDTRREGNYLTLDPANQARPSRLNINYSPATDQDALTRKAIKTVKKALLRLGCIVPPGMVHIRPIGASAHYAGTLPASRKKAPWTTSELCQSHDFENLFIVDGATFPFLPAKNITFTLMANAVRVADNAF
jgi:choline dehydrogenase-like flavoprotein